VKYGNKLVVLTKEETVLQGMVDRLIDTWICYGMEMKVGKTKIKRISRHPSPVQIMVGQKQLDSVEYLNYLGS
jgi:hypothetical protein